SLTDEQRMLQETAQRVIETEYSFEQRREQLADATDFAPGLWRTLAELGLLGLPFGEDVGGFGGDQFDVAVVMQALGRGLAVTPYIPTVVLGGTLLSASSPHHALLEKISTGDLQLAWAFAEPQARFDLTDTLTRAQESNDGFTLNGRKSVVVNAPGADYLIVSARTSGNQRDTNGLSLFLVPRAANGVRMKAYRTNDDHWAADVSFENVTLARDALVGTVDDAWELIESTADVGTVALCAEALGAMDQIMDLTKDYLNTREQFGKLIGKNQALQFRMVEMFYQVEESRSLLGWALRALDGDATQRRAAVSATKVKVGEAARFLGQQGIQLHGAIGMTEEFPIGHYYKRLESIRVMFGDPDYHLARFGRWNQAQNDE
ncbi:MAG: alkylation response protein AidB-like acyl-CoA dehydrogenase, partial [Gammaproteobacteria bacterium]